MITIEVSEDEEKLIRAIREDPMLKKAIFRYFEAMSGVELSGCSLFKK